MSNTKGFNETLNIPVSNKDNTTNNKVIEGGLKTVNSNVLLLFKNVNTINNKIQGVDEVKRNIENLQKGQTLHTQMLTEIYELLRKATTPDEKSD